MARSFSSASSQYLNLGTAAGLQITGDISISFSMKTSTTSALVIMSCYNGSSPYTGWGVGIGQTTVGKLCYWSSGNGAWRGSNTSVNDNAWRHCGITVNGTGASAGKFFVDGVADGTFTQTAPGAWTGQKVIGYNNELVYFNGSLAEMAVWNVSLTAAEMAALSAGYSADQIRPGSLVAYWPLIGRLSPEIELWSGYNGTLTNAPAQDAHPRIIYPSSGKKIFLPPSSRTAPAISVVESDEVDWSNPVVREHPLMRGCGLFAVPLPGRMVDLLGRYRGTYTSMVPSTSTGLKSAFGRPGGSASLQLDGSNDYVTFGSSFNGAMSTIGAASQSMSVAAWFKTTTSGVYANIIDKGASSTSRQFQLFFNTGDGKLRFQHYSGSSPWPYIDAAGLYNDGKWHHVVAVRDCTNSVMKIYIDGRDDGTTGSNSNINNDYSATSSIDIGNNRNAMTAFFPGYIDEVMIWPSRALTAADVRQLYHQSRRGWPEVLRRTQRPIYHQIGVGSSMVRRLASMNSIYGSAIAQDVLEI